MKRYFHRTILLLCLTIYLKMEGNKKLYFDIEEITKQKPELQHKNHSVFANDRVRKVLVLSIIISVSFGALMMSLTTS